ncbi:MAG: Lactate utilization protein B [Calditrichaeota bacterium]|nr:Lactate utilization protein B [Calditrichota bacterium]
MPHGTAPKQLKDEIDAGLQSRGEPPPFKTNTRKAANARDGRAGEWPDFERRRAHAAARRQYALDHLDELHERLREHWRRRGVIVHHAPNSAIANDIILGIVRDRGARTLLKGKSMLSEEIGLNDYLARHGVEPVETDLGEYIVQLRGETPSHITMPGMHLDRTDVGRLFSEKLGGEYTDDPPALTRIARRALREKFLTAKVGMVGVNFAVAGTGHLATVTNEGNGRLVSTLPDTVIGLMGYERVTESLADLALLWQLLARSATGQRATVYLNMLHGPSPGPSGPREVHVVIVDNGRRRLNDDPELREVLRCIRCGACLNACPVYQQVGGHPYGGTYPGPIGIVLTPALKGAGHAPDHPFASSLCGACEEICPVSIPLPEMMLKLRARSVDERAKPDPERAVWRVFREVMGSRRRYELAAKLARGAQALWPGREMPIPGWTDHRDAPRFAKKPFRDLFHEDER